MSLKHLAPEWHRLLVEYERLADNEASAPGPFHQVLDRIVALIDEALARDAEDHVDAALLIEMALFEFDSDGRSAEALHAALRALRGHGHEPVELEEQSAEPACGIELEAALEQVHPAAREEVLSQIREAVLRMAERR
jgi:hypothetical protein